MAKLERDENGEWKLTPFEELATGGIVNPEQYKVRHVGDGKGVTLEKIVPLRDIPITINGEMFAKVISKFTGSFPKIIAVAPDSIKGRIFEYFDKQTDKGVNKYGHTLDDCPDDKFDWKLMMIEELVDCVQYAYKEISRLEKLLSPDDEDQT